MRIAICSRCFLGAGGMSSPGGKHEGFRLLGFSRQEVWKTKAGLIEPVTFALN